jgi:hypothetical protein
MSHVPRLMHSRGAAVGAGDCLSGSVWRWLGVRADHRLVGGVRVGGGQPGNIVNTVGQGPTNKENRQVGQHYLG